MIERYILVPLVYLALNVCCNCQIITNDKKKELLQAFSEKADSTQWLQSSAVTDYLNGYLLIPDGNIYSHPYFLKKEWVDGSVLFEGQQYPVANLMYDSYKDLLLCLKKVENAYIPICLKPDFIKGFALKNYHFVHLGENDNLPSFMKPGFYELCTQGRVKLFVRYTKLQTIKPPNIFEYENVETMYLLRGNRYYRVKGKHELMTLLKDKKKELKAFKKKNDIAFIGNKINASKRIVAFYNQISK